MTVVLQKKWDIDYAIKFLNSKQGRKLTKDMEMNQRGR